MFRFTIRDVLWLMVVVALRVGWWFEYLSTAAIDQIETCARAIARSVLLIGEDGPAVIGGQELAVVPSTSLRIERC